MSSNYLASIIHSEDIKIFGVNSTDLMEDNGKSLDNIFECAGRAMLMYDFLPEITSNLRLAIDLRKCELSLSALACLDEYLKRVKKFCDLFHGRVDIYREASIKGSRVAIFSKCSSDVDDYKLPRSESLRFNEYFGHPNITVADVKEFLFGIGIEESYLYAGHRSLILAMRNLIQLLLDVREICLRGLSTIDCLCPAFRESSVKEPVRYIKAQINAVNEYEVTIRNSVKNKRPDLRIVQ